MIELSLSSQNLIALAQQINQQPFFQESLPDKVEYDYDALPITRDWAKKIGAQVFEAEWDDERRLAVYPGATVELTLPLPPEPDTIIDWLSGIDFELASFRSLYPEWRQIDPEYVAPSFANRHRPHGPFAAIKGEGHKRLVSNRWLDYSPVKVTRRDDLTFVQFHDLHADAATSLKQAKPGHIALSSEPEGGFIKYGYLPRHDFKGLYDEKNGVLKISVLGRSISPREMLDACALRLEGEVNGKKVSNLAYVFLDENEIGDHLHQLWLRGLECWMIRDGREVRLDKSYNPPPPVMPEWAR